MFPCRLLWLLFVVASSELHLSLHCMWGYVSIGNYIDDFIEFTWSSVSFISSRCGQSTKVSSTYLSHSVGFSDVVSNAISSNYSIHRFAIAGDNGGPITKPSSSRYVFDPIPKCVACVQKISIYIRLSIGILVRSPKDESEASCPWLTITFPPYVPCWPGSYLVAPEMFQPALTI